MVLPTNHLYPTRIQKNAPLDFEVVTEYVPEVSYFVELSATPGRDYYSWSMTNIRTGIIFYFGSHNNKTAITIEDAALYIIQVRTVSRYGDTETSPSKAFTFPTNYSVEKEIGDTMEPIVDDLDYWKDEYKMLERDLNNERTERLRLENKVNDMRSSIENFLTEFAVE